MSKKIKSEQEKIGLNQPGFLYLNEQVLMNVRQATGDAGEGTIDELKFGPLFVRISEMLFPWCSTLTTRARYFFFTYAVLQLALERTVPSESRNSQRDATEAISLAVKRRSTFARHIRRIEKYLALALHLRGDTDGTFGKRRANRWLNDDGGRYAVASRNYENILSVDSRYSNVIYRRISQRLGLFESVSSNAALISAQLRNLSVFSVDWSVAGVAALTELRGVVDFWERFEASSPNSSLMRVSLSDAAHEFSESPSARAFNGFGLSNAEADFLYQKIQVLTPYWKAVPLANLKELYKDQVSEVELLAAFAGTAAERYLETACHIDVVTRYWSQHYSLIASGRGETVSLEEIFRALTEIQASIEWLNAAAVASNTVTGWENIWSETYSELFATWVGIVKRGDARGLANELMFRAEDVVRERGRGKIAPHKRPSTAGDEEDLKSELDLTTLGFRFSNANRLLLDIAHGGLHG